MNKRIRALAKKNFKEKFIAFFPHTKSPGLPENHLLRILVLLISYLVIGVIVYLISEVLATVFIDKLGQAEGYFTYTAILVSLTIIIYSTFEIISDFYSSKETEILLSMPLKEDDIFLGKLIGNIASDIDYYLFFAIIFVVYFLHADFSLIMLIMGILAFGSVIVTTYCLLSLVIMLIMRFTNVRRYKTFFKFLAYGLGLLAFGAYYYFIFSAGDSNFDGQSIEVFIEGLDSFKKGVEGFFFQASLFGKAVGSKNFLYFIALMGVGLLSYLLVKFVASKIYLDSIIEKDSSSPRKKRAKDKKTEFHQSSQAMALAKKELGSIVKNPVYLYQSGLFVVIMVAIFLGLSRAMGENLDFTSLGKELGPEFENYIYAILLGGGLLLAGLIFSNNVTAFSSLSREGKSFYLIQTLPIDPSSNVMGRFLGLYLINIVISLLVSLILYFIAGLSLAKTGLFFLGMAVGSIFPVFYSLYWGTKKIYTTWDKPSELSRTGLIGFGMVLLSWLINAVIFGLAFGVFWLSDSLILSVLMVFLGHIIGSLLFYLLTVERYKKGFFDVK